MNINMLSSVAITLVVAGIVIALGLNIMSETQAEFTTAGDGCNSTNVSGCNAEYNATGDAIDGVGKLGAKMPLIGLVVAAVVVISLIAGAFSRR